MNIIEFINDIKLINSVLSSYYRGRVRKGDVIVPAREGILLGLERQYGYPQWFPCLGNSVLFLGATVVTAVI